MFKIKNLTVNHYSAVWGRAAICPHVAMGTYTREQRNPTARYIEQWGKIVSAPMNSA